jgi:hypothetical protein
MRSWVVIFLMLMMTAFPTLEGREWTRGAVPLAPVLKQSNTRPR